MQALAERTGAFFVRHATVPHQMAFTNKFGPEQGAAPLLRQHNNAQNELEERLPLWWAAAEVETIAPSCAPVNEAAHTSWVISSNLNWAQQKNGSKYELLAYLGNDYSGLRTAPASESCPLGEGPFAEAGGLLSMLFAFGAASLVGKSKPRR